MYTNTFLKAFGPEAIARLRLKSVVFKIAQKIEAPGEPIRYVYFLDNGMASMTTTFKDGSEVEVGMFGYASAMA